MCACVCVRACVRVSVRAGVCALKGIIKGEWVCGKFVHKGYVESVQYYYFCVRESDADAQTYANVRN